MTRWRAWLRDAPLSTRTVAVMLVLLLLVQAVAFGIVRATVNAQVLDELCGLPDRHQVARLVVYAPRPKALAALLAERGIAAQVHALRQALIQGQGGRLK